MSEANQALPVRIFAIGDAEWWIGAVTPEQMRDAYRATYGDHALSDDEDELPRPLDDHELSLYRYYYGPENDAPTLALSRTFAEQLQLDVSAGVPAPRLFAAEEY